MDSIQKIMMDASINMWDKIIVNGGEFKSDGIKQHIEVRLIDKTTNSLKQLNNYLGIMGAAQKRRDKIQTLDPETPPYDTVPQIGPDKAH